MGKRYFLFDLDGTLNDSSEGITKSVQYALENAGINEINQENLLNYIGPPLIESFQKFNGLSEEEAVIAVAKYRERFSDVGLFENVMIPGMEDILKALQKRNVRIALATCKPEPFALRILEYFNIAQYFDVAVGSCMDGTRSHKDEVIEEVFRQLKEKKLTYSDEDIYSIKADSIMIGDRKDDILGAKETMIESVGVRFGFAKENELEDAGADYIADTVAELGVVCGELISM